jgi:hypothetical protein
MKNNKKPSSKNFRFPVREVEPKESDFQIKSYRQVGDPGRGYDIYFRDERNYQFRTRKLDGHYLLIRKMPKYEAGEGNSEEVVGICELSNIDQADRRLRYFARAAKRSLLTMI